MRKLPLLMQLVGPFQLSNRSGHFDKCEQKAGRRNIICYIMDFDDRCKRRRIDHDLSEGSKTMLKEAVLQLVTYHQDPDKVFSETTSMLQRETTKGKDSEILRSSLQGLVPHSFSTSDFHAIEACANKLLDIVRQRKATTTFCSTIQGEVTAVVLMTKNLMENRNLQRPRFYNILCKESCLPLDVIWSLHEAGVMNMEAYLSFKQNEKSFVELVVQQIFDRLEIRQDDKFSLESLINYLSQLAFPDKSEPEKLTLKKFANVILDSVILKLVDTMTTDSKSVILPVASIQQRHNLDNMKKQYGHVINLILTHRPTTARSAFGVQTDYTYPRSPPLLVTMFKQLLLVFDVEEVVEILRQIQDRPIRWPHLLTLVSTFIVCLSTATDSLFELVSSLLRTGLEGSDMDQVTVAFLLARQVCLEGTHVAMPYQDWFQRMFGDGAQLLTTTRKTFTFLMRFLTELVPFESTAHLKVHIVRPPSVPPKCRELLTDYIMLAKTRLADLKDPIDLTGDRRDGDKRKILEQTERDVQLALSTFEGTNKIPSSVMEASIFRKPYFIGRFVPALLKPRPLPDVPDVRMKFIDTLKRVEKIPTNMYNAYVTACRQEAAKLLQGVFPDDEEDDITEMTMDPLEQLEHRLGQLIDTLTLRPTSPCYNLKEPELMSIIREKMSLTLDEESNQSPQRGVVMVDAHSPQLSLIHIKVVDLLLNVICKVTSHSLQTDQPDLTWASNLVSIIGEFPTLHKALYTRVWKIIMETGSKLEEHHIQGIAMTMCQMCVHCDLFGEACIQVSGGVSLTDTLSRHIWSQGSIRSAQCMQFMLRLTTAYLQCVFSCLDGTQLSSRRDTVIPRPLVTLFVFLCHRLLPEIRNHYNPRGPGQFRLTHLIYRSKKFTEFCQHIQLTFKEWVTMEMTVCPDLDLLSFHERREYHCWCVYQKFSCSVPQIENQNQTLNTGCLDVREACSILMEALLTESLRHIPKCTVSCGQCHHDNRTGVDHGGRADFVHLLQEIVTKLPSTGNKEDCGSPWLLQQLHKALQEYGSDSLGTEAILHHFIRLAMCLPAHLFYCDNVHRLTDSGLGTTSCDVINTNLKHGLCHGSCFPLSVTQYLIQGMVDCARYTDVSRVFMEAPILSISTLVHIQHIGDVMRMQTEKQQDISFLLTVQWLQEYLSGQKETPPDEATPWMVAAAALSITLSSEEVPQDLLTDISCTGDSNETLAVYCHLVLAELTTIHMCNSETEKQCLQDSCVYVLQLCPSVLTTVVHPTADHLAYTSEGAQRTEHLTLLRLLCDSKTFHVLDISHGLDCIITMFGSVVRMFDQGQTFNGPGCETEVFSIQEILHLAEFVKNCIKLSTIEQLNRIECKDNVKMCGADIYMTFKQQMSRM